MGVRVEEMCEGALPLTWGSHALHDITKGEPAKVAFLANLLRSEASKRCKKMEYYQFFDKVETHNVAHKTVLAPSSEARRHSRHQWPVLGNVEQLPARTAR